VNQQSLFTFGDVDEPLPEQELLGQYMTPRWAAQLLFERYFADATPNDTIIEPSCGEGAWLAAVPADIPAFGVEIDPVLAARAREGTGRRIIIGDFTNVALDVEPTIAIGNLPFRAATIAAFIRRLHDIMPPASRCGFVLPAHTFSFASSTMNLMRGFGVQVDILPRDLWSRIRFPLVFARLTREQGPARLIGFALFDEALAIRAVRRYYRSMLERGRRPRYRELFDATLDALGGEATLSQMYAVLESMPPSDTPTWRDSLRRTAGEHGERLAPGRFRKKLAIAAS
jgi:adenine-specific DNA-methyltransferase